MLLAVREMHQWRQGSFMATNRSYEDEWRVLVDVFDDDVAEASSMLARASLCSPSEWKLFESSL